MFIRGLAGQEFVEDTTTGAVQPKSDAHNIAIAAVPTIGFHLELLAYAPAISKAIDRETPT